MKFSLQLPVHLILYIISSLDKDNLSHAEPAPPTLVYPERVAVHGSPFSLKSSSRLSSNWTQRATLEEGELEDVLCHPAGSCEPCPEDLLQEPYCQPFGNRRLLHCIEVPSAPESDRPSPDTRPDGEEPETDDNRDEDLPHVPPPYHPASRPPQSAMPAYESCGRRVPKERADFLEFVLCNVIFAALALTGVLIRSERMRAVRARRLAARIGVGLRRASSGSWAAVGGMGAALVEAEARSEEAQLMRDDDSGS